MGKYHISRRHMNKNRRILNLSLIIVSVLVFGVVTAYAALNMTVSSKFNMVRQRYVDNASNGSNSSNGANWTENYNASLNSGTYNAWWSYNGYNGNQVYPPSCGKATISGNQITVDNVYITAPNAQCIYEVPMRNNGGTTATIAAITSIKATGQASSCVVSNDYTMVCGKHTYVLSTYSSTSGNPLNKTIYGYGSLSLYLIISYNGTAPASSYYDAYSYNGGFKVNFK